MSAPLELYEFPDRWSDLRGETAREPRDIYWREMITELGKEHALSREGEVIAMFHGSDELLVRLGPQYVMVHLTMAGRRDHYVTMEWVGEWAEAVALVEGMHRDW